MRIVQVLFSGLGGHANVLFSYIDASVINNDKNEYTALFCGVENVNTNYKNGCKERQINYLNVVKEPGKHFTYYKNIYSQLKKINPEIIFLHGSSNILPAYFYKLLKHTSCKIIVRETQANHLKTKVDSLFLFVCFLLATKIVFLTEEYQQQIIKKYSFLFPKKKCSVISNGVNLNKFIPNKLQSNNNIIKIGMLSRLNSIKDHITLIKAIEYLIKTSETYKNRIQLYIAGSGDTFNKLSAYVYQQNLTNEVKFLGNISEEEIPTFLNSLDIYTHASFGETLSTSLLQVMACRIPIIASNVDGINNVLTHKLNAILVEVENENEMADAIFTLMNDQSLRSKLATAAYNLVSEKYSNVLMHKKYIRLFYES